MFLCVLYRTLVKGIFQREYVVYKFLLIPSPILTNILYKLMVPFNLYKIRNRVLEVFGQSRGYFIRIQNNVSCPYFELNYMFGLNGISGLEARAGNMEITASHMFHELSTLVRSPYFLYNRSIVYLRDVDMKRFVNTNTWCIQSVL